MIFSPLMLGFKRAVVGFTAVCALAACASVSQAPEALPARDDLAAFALEGRFSLRHQDKNYSGRLSWRHSAAGNEVLLSSPFGQGMAEITSNDQGARLTTNDGKVYSAPDSEALTQQVLGYALPLTRLADWVRARGGAGGTAERDAHGRILRWHHEGWTIDYSYESDAAQAPPSRIFAEQAGGIELRLRIDEWNSLLP